MVPRARLRVPPRRTPRSLRVPAVLGALAVVVLLGALPFALAPGFSGTPIPPTDLRNAPAAAASEARSIHVGHPADAARAVPSGSLGNGSGNASATTYEVCNTNVIQPWSNFRGYACFNFTLTPGGFCAPSPQNSTLADLGLAMTVATTPANATGPAPMTFGWNITVGGGGLPPYVTEILVYDAQASYNSTARNGSFTITQPGIYSVDVVGEDASCTQTAFTSFGLDVYGAWGAHPVAISAVANSSVVPANVTYTVNTTALPANTTVIWTSAGTFQAPSTAGVRNMTYLLPGAYSTTACWASLDANGTPSGVLLGCGSSPTVTLGGVGPFSTSSAVGNGSYPVNVSFWVNYTGGATLPNGTYLYLIAYAADGAGTWVETNNSTSLEITESEGCGGNWTLYDPVSGNCSFQALWSLDGPVNGPDAGFLASGSIFAYVGTNLSPTLLVPSIAYSYGPLNGSLPLNLTVNLSATGGVAPYSFGYTVFGRSNGSANATLYATRNATVSPWNGTNTTIVVPLTRVGVYYASFFVNDSADSWVGFALPLIVLGNVSPLAPLVVTASTGTGGSNNSSAGGEELPAGGDAWFEAAPQGGTAPYTIQWDFGDGSFGSSVAGATVEHSYLVAGSYTPSVTVTDAAGRVVRETLPVVVVRATPSSGPEGTVAAGAGPTHLVVDPTALVWAGLAAAGLVLVGLSGAARERERQGEELVRSLHVEAPGSPSNRGR